VRAGALISGAAHAAVVALALRSLLWLSPPPETPVETMAVRLVDPA
jgi:hypothetical protein